MSIKKYNGSTWSDTKVLKHNGNGYENAVVRKHNGSSWDTISSQLYSDTWICTWTSSQGGNGRYGVTSEAGRGYRMYQGRYGDPYASWYDWGVQRSMAGFDYLSMQSKLSGAEIEKVEIYLHNEHWWYYAGGKAVIGAHNETHDDKSFSHTEYGIKTVGFEGRGQAKWIEMPRDFGNKLRDGKAKGFTLYAESGSPSYYGYFSGYGSAYAPKIRVTYRK